MEFTHEGVTYQGWDLDDPEARERLEEMIGAEAVEAAVVEALAGEARKKRDALLAEIDWTQALDAPITPQCREALRLYRQALRDIPQRPEFPHIEDWPECPPIEKGAADPVDEAFDVLVGGENHA